MLNQPPDSEYLPAQFWDVSKLSHWLSTTFSVEYASDSSYHFLLRMEGCLIPPAGEVRSQTC